LKGFDKLAVQDGLPARSSRTGDAIALDAKTYKQAVYAALRDMITELEIQPGIRLVEADLAARFGVSKTPVREALALLEADGLVEVAPYRGATVRWLSLVEMVEREFLIDAIELPALPLVVARITPAELADVGRVARELKRTRAAGDGRTFRTLTAEMHRLLFASIGYPRVSKFISILVGPVGLRYDRVFCQFEDTWDIQLALLLGRYEGVKRRDAEGAAAAVHHGRAEITKLNMSRLGHPLVAPLFAPGEVDRSRH
jgi:DNA-binding GntR family transcriptional regulator